MLTTNLQYYSQLFVTRPAQTYTLTFLEHPEYLHARVEAKRITRTIVLEYIREIAEKCLEVNAKRLLFDRNISTTLNPADIFFTAGEFAEMMSGITVAIVNRCSRIDEDMNFLVTVARNRGGMFSLHSDVASAERLLLGNIQPQTH